MYRAPLVLVTGPSGAGKDSILAAARSRLAGDGRFVFPRRVITRPAVPGGEPHVAVTAEAFVAMRAAGRFALCWEAYGRHYGIGSEIAQDLAAGRCVVANVSRTVIDQARRLYPPVLVVALEVPAEVLADRLAARQRESADEIAARLARAALPVAAGADVVRLRNDEGLERCVGGLLRLLMAQVPSGNVAAD